MDKLSWPWISHSWSFLATTGSSDRWNVTQNMMVAPFLLLVLISSCEHCAAVPEGSPRRKLQQRTTPRDNWTGIVFLFSLNMDYIGYIYIYNGLYSIYIIMCLIMYHIMGLIMYHIICKLYIYIYIYSLIYIQLQDIARYQYSNCESRAGKFPSDTWKFLAGNTYDIGKSMGNIWKIWEFVSINYKWTVLLGKSINKNRYEQWIFQCHFTLLEGFYFWKIPLQYTTILSYPCRIGYYLVLSTNHNHPQDALETTQSIPFWLVVQ